MKKISILTLLTLLSFFLSSCVENQIMLNKMIGGIYGAIICIPLFILFSKLTSKKRNLKEESISLALEKYQIEEYDKAIEILNNIEKTVKNEKDMIFLLIAYKLKGVFLFYSGQIDESKQILRKTIKLFEEKFSSNREVKELIAEAYLFLSAIYFKENNLIDAQTNKIKALELDSSLSEYKFDKEIVGFENI
jgi:tetratricopeptide (TPR) repeat protein